MHVGGRDEAGGRCRTEASVTKPLLDRTTARDPADAHRPCPKPSCCDDGRPPPKTSLASRASRSSTRHLRTSCVHLCGSVQNSLTASAADPHLRLPLSECLHQYSSDVCKGHCYQTFGLGWRRDHGELICACSRSLGRDHGGEPGTGRAAKGCVPLSN